MNFLEQLQSSEQLGLFDFLNQNPDLCSHAHMDAGLEGFCVMESCDFHTSGGLQLFF